MNSHLESKLGHIVSAPVLSIPYLHVEDAMTEAPERALILLDTLNATYQFVAIGDEHRTYKHVRALVNGIYHVTDLVAIAYNLGDEWCHWVD